MKDQEYRRRHRFRRWLSHLRLQLATRQLVPSSAALKALAGSRSFLHYREELRRVYLSDGKVSFLLSSVVYRAARLTVDFACWAAIKRRYKREPKIWNTRRFMREDLLETACDVQQISLKSCKDIAYYINVFGRFSMERVLQWDATRSLFYRIEIKKKNFKRSRSAYISSPLVLL